MVSFKLLEDKTKASQKNRQCVGTTVCVYFASHLGYHCQSTEAQPDFNCLFICFSERIKNFFLPWTLFPLIN